MNPDIPPAAGEPPLTADKLPELNTGLLDWPEVERLLRDIELCTTLLAVLPKFAARGHVPEAASVTLAEARELLATRAVRGLQLRYRHEGAEWWDTLLSAGEQFRLVRIRHEFGAG